MRKPNTVRDFWDLVDMSGGPDLCWLWLGCRSSSGYGTVWLGRVQQASHRVALERKLGRPVKGQACHKCDNRRCCNPFHLFEGTPTDNMSDCSRKGRIARGERQHLAALSTDVVRSLRECDIATSHAARILGVHQTTVDRALRGATWRHV